MTHVKRKTEFIRKIWYSVISLDLLCTFLLRFFFTILNIHLNILFVCYHFKANEIKTSLLKPVRTEAGLGDPPNEFITNDVESATS